MSAFKAERSVDQKTAEDGNGSLAEIRRLIRRTGKPTLWR